MNDKEAKRAEKLIAEYCESLEQTAIPAKMSGVPSIEEDLEIIEIIEIPVVPKILPAYWLRIFARVEYLKKRLDDMRQEIERIKKRSGWERVNEAGKL